MQNLIVLVLVIFCCLAWSSLTCLRNPPHKMFIRIMVIISVFSRGCCFYILSSYKHFPQTHLLLLTVTATSDRYTWSCCHIVHGTHVLTLYEESRAKYNLFKSKLTKKKKRCKMQHTIVLTNKRLIKLNKYVITKLNII